MEKLFTTRTMYTDDYMDGGYNETTVLLTRREARFLKARDEETIYMLFSVAEVMSEYYAGPGRAFIHGATFHIEWKKIHNYKPVAVITQRFGFDI